MKHGLRLGWLCSPLLQTSSFGSNSAWLSSAKTNFTAPTNVAQLANTVAYLPKHDGSRKSGQSILLYNSKNDKHEITQVSLPFEFELPLLNEIYFLFLQLVSDVAECLHRKHCRRKTENNKAYYLPALHTKAWYCPLTHNSWQWRTPKFAKGINSVPQGSAASSRKQRTCDPTVLKLEKSLLYRYEILHCPTHYRGRGPSCSCCASVVGSKHQHQR